MGALLRSGYYQSFEGQADNVLSLLVHPKLGY